MSDPARTVAVWRTELLAGTETFIRSQVDSLDAWRGELLGARRVESALVRAGDYVAFDDSTRGTLVRRSFRLLRRSARIERRVTSSEAQLVHAHFIDDAALIAPTASRLSLPLVVTVHGNDVTATGSGPGWTLARSRRPRAYQQAERVVAVSRFLADRVTSLGIPARKIEVLPIGIPTGSTAATTATTHDDKVYDIAFVGRLVEKKGAIDLLRAVASLRAPLRASRIAIVGDGPLRGGLESFVASAGLNASFLGSMGPDAVSRVLSSSRIFVGPSKTATDGDAEGFGMVFLEAALHRLPVVAYRHGGVPEAVEDGRTGLLAEEGNVRELAAMITALLTEETVAADMGLAGRARVLASFDVRARTRELERLYDCVVAS